jgi:hypothetical protein
MHIHDWRIFFILARIREEPGPTFMSPSSRSRWYRECQRTKRHRLVSNWRCLRGAGGPHSIQSGRSFPRTGSCVHIRCAPLRERSCLSEACRSMPCGFVDEGFRSTAGDISAKRRLRVPLGEFTALLHKAGKSTCTPKHQSRVREFNSAGAKLTLTRAIRIDASRSVRKRTFCESLQCRHLPHVGIPRRAWS